MAQEAQELLPYRHVLRSTVFKKPIEGILIYRGNPVPVLGPMPQEGAETLDVDQRPWILVVKNCAQVVRGLPSLEEAVSGNVIPMNANKDEENHLLEEIDELLKGA